MTTRLLEEDFRKMGLNSSEVGKAMNNLFEEISGMGLPEADLDEGDDLDEDFEEDEDEDEDELDEAARTKRMKKTSSAEKIKSKRYYRSKKSKIKKSRLKFARSARGKIHAKFLKAHEKGGGARTRRQFADNVEGSVNEDAFLTEDEQMDLAAIIAGIDSGLDEAAIIKRMKRSSSLVRRKAKQYYRSHKANIKKRRIKVGRSATGRLHKAWLKAHQKKGGARTRRVFASDRDMPNTPSLGEGHLRDMMVLAESLDRDPVELFEQYVEAFNKIADIGELLAIQYYNEGDEESAVEAVGIAMDAEAVLEEMEDAGGALTPDENEALEEALAESMDDVGDALSERGLLEQDDEDEDEDEDDEDEDEDDEDDEEEEEDEEEIEEEDYDNPYFDLSDELDEARAAIQRKRTAGTKKKAKGGKSGSLWGAKHGPGDARAQVSMRKDARNPEALLGYLKAVKAGIVKPGQPLGSKGGKKLSPGAMKAKAMAGRGYRGKSKAG